MSLVLHLKIENLLKYFVEKWYVCFFIEPNCSIKNRRRLFDCVSVFEQTNKIIVLRYFQIKNIFEIKQ